MTPTDPGHPLPNSNQLLLLKACLWPNNNVAYFKSWAKYVDFENDVEWSSYRLLPLLYDKLKVELKDEPIGARLKGIYRKHWSATHILLNKALPALKALKQAKVRVLLLKGIPLGVQYYKNVALRPMADVDLMVPREERQKAAKVLISLGFTLKDKIDLENWLCCYYQKI